MHQIVTYKRTKDLAKHLFTVFIFGFETKYGSATGVTTDFVLGYYFGW